jgi:hypothetical protein
MTDRPDDDDIWRAFGFDDDDDRHDLDRQPREIALDDQVTAAVRDLADELLPQVRAVEQALCRTGAFAKARQVRRVRRWLEDVSFAVITDGLT